MQLVFIHGWGLDSTFWGPLADLLKDYPQRCIERGYCGAPVSEIGETKNSVLIGHSLGFMYGAEQKSWAGWVAINSFARFVQGPDGNGCTPTAALRDLRIKLANDPRAMLKDFHTYIVAAAPQGEPNAGRLREGLDELRDGDIEPPAVPGLILASENDPLVPAKASEALAARAKNAQLIWHPTGGHVLPQADPAWCAQHIKAYLQGLSAQNR